MAMWAAREKLPALALTDIGNLYGWAKWTRAAKAGGFRPLYGCEIELGGEGERGGGGNGGERFLFLVKSLEGYGNLMEILNRREVRDTAGLVTIYLPPPKGGPKEAGAAKVALESGAAGDVYIGADVFNFPLAAAFARERNLPLVWANPLKFVVCPERLVLVRALEKKVPYPPEWESLRRRVALYGPDGGAAALRKFGEAAAGAFRRTFEVAEKCVFAFAGVVPPLPADVFPVTLRDEVMSRLRGRKDLGWDARQRARRELAVIEKSGFGPYFLIVHDVVEFARRNGILHNLKGSGASSFLGYLLGLSHVDPLAFDLYFERFLNAGRPDPPDIDLDFDSRHRDKVLSYVLERYGKGRTGAAFVCSLKNFGARSALYETARAFGLPPEESRALSKKAPYFADPVWLKQAAPPPGYLEVWKLASELTSVYHEISLHVGGVILTPAPVDRYLPLETSAKGLLMSHYDRDAVEDLKLIKLDLLSVRGLAAVSAAKAGLGLAEIPAGDAKTFGLLKQARTIGCFQVESPAMMNLLRRMKPATIFDLTTALALIRPGPTESGMKEGLLRSREGRGGACDPFLAKILPETGGVLLYEEQVMQIAERVAGMPPEEGDFLRRRLKKKGDPPADLRARFLKEAKDRGYAAGEVEKLWQTMEKFSSYSFNKAHSASYAAMAYQAVYLKAHHPLPYLAAVLNAGGGYYELAEYVEEAKRLGIRILGPDANRSGPGFEVEGAAIRVGFTAIKGLPLRTMDKILEERGGGGPFATIEDFLARVTVSKSELFTLIKAGVFDSLEAKRTRQILRYFQGIDGLEVAADLDPREKARMLLDSLGFSPDGDPLALYEGKRPDLRIKDLRRHAGRTVELVVRVVDARGREVAGGQKYFYLFEDETGLLEGLGDRKCLTIGEPPVCCLRGEPRPDGTGTVKIHGCSFLKAF
jgi:DNA polymerase-3 subunit alpha/error-prone DNA polymerase